MPDYLILKGYTGTYPNALQTKDVPLQVNNGVFAVARPTLSGTDKSTVTGVAASTLITANSNRMGFYVKNDTAIDVFINIGGTAVAAAGGGNIKIPANGGYFESGTFTPSEAISIIAASGTPAITAREY